MAKGQTMHRTLMALALAGAAGSLGACGLFEDVRSVTNELAKDSRNQDDIATGAGLTMPPDMSLRPPSTSTSAMSGEGTARRAQVILKTTEVGASPTRGAAARGAREDGPTTGERELMTRSGVTTSTSDVVRKTVDIESTRRTAGQKDFTDRVMKYDPKAKPAKDDEKNARDGSGDRPTIKRPGEL
jgi:hypothetical protein